MRSQAGQESHYDAMGLIAAAIVVGVIGCVDLTVPPSLLARPDESTEDAGAADRAASGGAPGSGGTGGIGQEAGSDAPSGVEAGTSDAADDVASGVDMGGVAADAREDVAQADAAPSLTDARGDLADAIPPPPTISFTDLSSLVYAPGTGGSTAYTGPCFGGSQALTGILATSGGVTGVNSVQGTCNVIAASGGPSYQLTTGPSSTLGPFGPVGPTSQNGSCPANQVVVGFEGASGSWINSMYVYCAPLTITGAPGGYTVTVGAPTKVPTRLGTDGGNPFAAHYCPVGHIGVGILGASGAAIDRFGLYCAKPVAQ
jgi:hypothetical protein